MQKEKRNLFKSLKGQSNEKVVNKDIRISDLCEFLDKNANTYLTNGPVPTEFVKEFATIECGLGLRDSENLVQYCTKE
jgi:hypothetical protein